MKEDINFADNILREIGVQNPILISPFAQSKTRDWHFDGWAKLISSLKDIPVIICGQEKHRADVDELIRLAARRDVYNLCGKTTVRQLAALVSRSRLCVSHAQL